jgi:hypothetical protein
MRNLFLLLSLLFAAQSQAQIIKMSILFYDIASPKKPVANGEILLRNAKTNEIYQLKTNEKGGVSLELPTGTDFFINTKYSPHSEYKLACATSRPNTQINVTHTDRSSEYYRNQQIQDSIADVESAKAQEKQAAIWKAESIRRQKEDSLAQIARKRQIKKEAELQKDAAANPSKYGKHYFYAVGNIDSYYYTVSVYEDASKKVLLSEINGIYPSKTCMGSLQSADKKPVLDKVGTYNYYAVSGDGKYEWTGKYVITANGSTATSFHIENAKKIAKK